MRRVQLEQQVLLGLLGLLVQLVLQARRVLQVLQGLLEMQARLVSQVLQARRLQARQE